MQLSRIHAITRHNLRPVRKYIVFNFSIHNKLSGVLNGYFIVSVLVSPVFVHRVKIPPGLSYLSRRVPIHAKQSPFQFPCITHNKLRISIVPESYCNGVFSTNLWLSQPLSSFSIHVWHGQFSNGHEGSAWPLKYISHHPYQAAHLCPRNIKLRLLLRFSRSIDLYSSNFNLHCCELMSFSVLFTRSDKGKTFSTLLSTCVSLWNRADNLAPVESESKLKLPSSALLLPSELSLYRLPFRDLNSCISSPLNNIALSDESLSLPLAPPSW